MALMALEIPKTAPGPATRLGPALAALTLAQRARAG